MTPRPFTLIAELTYRCPLACPYCSNPAAFGEVSGELSAETWGRVFAEARELGVVQVHLTGGEPLVRRDLEAVVRHAQTAGLYTNLVTSGIPFERERLARIAASVEHLQLSVQAPEAGLSDRIAGRRAFADKREAARVAVASGTPVTLNFVLHRENLEHLDRMLELSLELGIERVELAHAQYHGVAFENRSALLPSAEAIAETRRRVRRARESYAGRLELAHVLPDYYADRPKACMDGWARRYLVVAPDGLALPCHGARGLPGLRFENVAHRPLAWIWRESPSFAAFRGEAWMKEPCRSCARRAEDFGGCRCQAFALTGDASATDPVCSLAPSHELVVAARRDAAKSSENRRYLYRSPRSELHRDRC